MTNSSKIWRGLFVIVTTPFDEHMKLDIAGLRKTVQFCIDAGAHGVVATANASEVGYLSDEERNRAAEAVVAEAGGKVTALVGVSSPCWSNSVDLVQHASAIGADGVMAMPPTCHPATEREMRQFYQRVSEASELPVMLQNYGGIGGTVMSPALMISLVRELSNVKYIKEETDYASIRISELLAYDEPELLGIMGGKAGVKLLDEYPRGICGTMPACEVTDVHAKVWNLLEAGDRESAKSVFRVLLPLLVSEIGYGPAVYKYVLRCRGVLESSAFRQTGGRVLDEGAVRELDEILSDLNEYFLPEYRYSKPV